jgi:hypothetical protein
LKSLFVKDRWWSFWMKSTKIEKLKDSQLKSRCLNSENTFKRKKIHLIQTCLNMQNHVQTHLMNAKIQVRFRYFFILYCRKQCQTEFTQKLMNSHSNVKKTVILNRISRLMNSSTILHNVWTDCVNAWRTQMNFKTNSSRSLKHTTDMLIWWRKQKKNVDMNTSCQKKSCCQIVLI